MEQVARDRSSLLAWLAAGLLALAVAAVLVAPAQASVRKGTHAQKIQRVTLVIKSDTEHGKKGPDGKWHDAFLPANFTVREGAKVIVTVVNYDEMPHSFTAPGLHVNTIIPMAMKGMPMRTTFTFTATKPGSFAWHCDPKCDAWSMAHWGFMKGHVRVVA